MTSDSEGELSEIQRNSDLYLKALMRMIAKGMRIRSLKGDAEKAFSSRKSEQIYRDHNINFIKVINAQGFHNQLNIIDRFHRTLRDLWYNIDESEIIEPRQMEYIVRMYNNAPHTTFIKVLGFKVSPAQMKEDRDLERYFIKRLLQINGEIKARLDYQLTVGSLVKVYNPKNMLTKRRRVVKNELFKIVGYEGSKYVLEGVDSGQILKVTRAFISPN
jgi:hypothetical protein